MTKRRISKVAVPVQCTILVPIEIELDFEANDAVEETDAGCGFISLDNVPDGDSVAIKLVETAIGSEDI
jgi:hypothetical protein